MYDSKERNSASLIEWYPSENSVKIIACDDDYGIRYCSFNPTERSIDAYALARDRFEWVGITKRVQQSIATLRQSLVGDFWIVSRCMDDKLWLVAEVRDCRQTTYYLYEPTKTNLQFLMVTNERIERWKLPRMDSIAFPARDGLTIHGYLTLLLDFDAPGPTVLKVHGGPWTRDYWGFDPGVQWLANRGYAVLQVNYRGSTGYYKKFTNAGNREWGRKMQDDLTDGVQWAVNKGITDPKKVAMRRRSGVSGMVGRF